MQLFTYPDSPHCRKVHSVIDLTEAPVEIVRVDVHATPKPSAFLAANPDGKVPTLVDGERVLIESNVICAYLAAKTASPLLPTGDERFDVWMWLTWEAANWVKHADVLMYENHVKQQIGRGAPSEHRVARASAAMRSLAERMERVLASRSFLVGDSLTLADIVLGVWMAQAASCGFPVLDLDHLSGWHERVRAIPEFAAWIPPALR